MSVLARTTFDLPAGTFHALVGGEGAHTLVYLHGFPDHPPTAISFLEQLARTHLVVAPRLRGYAASPRVEPYDVATLAGDITALIDQLGGNADLRNAAGRDLVELHARVAQPEQARGFFNRVDRTRTRTQERLAQLADAYTLHGKQAEAAVVRAQPALP